MVDHSHIPKQCPMILVYLGSEIHRDGIGWNQKNQKKAFTASCLAAPQKCLQNSTHVHAGMECRDSFKQSDCQAKACPHLRHRACSPALLPSVFFCTAWDIMVVTAKAQAHVPCGVSSERFLPTAEL